ncbi:MAG: helix-turn-helix domain-containing protein [Conexibacteraceae bacterium]|nr:helix-turn-helix domain-containing protein [Conexibacteraceae bacterium]
MTGFATTLDLMHEDAGSARTVVHGAFGVLAALHLLGSARVGQLERRSGLPRTTVRRLLGQLEAVGAVESNSGRWRLGPTLVELGAGVPACPPLRAAARRSLMDLAHATGELVSLVVESAGQLLVIEVFPGTRRLAFEPEPGTMLEDPGLAVRRARERARNGNLQPVIDAGAYDRRISSVAAPLRLSAQDFAFVWVITPGGSGIPASIVAATRHASDRIAAQLGAPFVSF